MLLLHPDWNLTSTMNPKYVSSTITADRETSVPISGKPNDNSLLRLRGCITQILLGTPYKTADINHNLWGILSSNASYKAQHHEVFDPPTRTVVYLIIPDNSTSVVPSCANTIHKSIWHNFKLHKSSERTCRTFIIDAVEYIWIRKLWHSETIYSGVTTKALMDNI